MLTRLWYNSYLYTYFSRLFLNSLHIWVYIVTALQDDLSATMASSLSTFSPQLVVASWQPFGLGICFRFLPKGGHRHTLLGLGAHLVLSLVVQSKAVFIFTFDIICKQSWQKKKLFMILIVVSPSAVLQCEPQSTPQFFAFFIRGFITILDKVQYPLFIIYLVSETYLISNIKSGRS